MIISEIALSVETNPFDKLIGLGERITNDPDITMLIKQESFSEWIKHSSYEVEDMI